MPRGTITRSRTPRNTDAYTEPAADADEGNDTPDTTPRRGSRRAFAAGASDGSRSPRVTEPAKPTRSRAGWGEFDKKKEETASGGFPDDYKLTSEAALIKILDNEPFVTYLQHWIDNVGKGKRKSYNCISEFDDCPLDARGDKPRARSCFNVVDFTDPDNPEVKILTAGPQLGTIIKNFATDPKGKTSPINRDDLYWQVSAIKKSNNNMDYFFVPVKARDVEEEWGIAPLSEDELKQFEDDCFTEEDVVKYDTRSDLKALAEEYLDS